MHSEKRDDYRQSGSGLFIRRRSVCDGMEKQVLRRPRRPGRRRPAQNDKSSEVDAVPLCPHGREPFGSLAQAEDIAPSLSSGRAFPARRVPFMQTGRPVWRIASPAIPIMNNNDFLMPTNWAAFNG